MLALTGDLCDYHSDVECDAANFYRKMEGESQGFNPNFEILKLVSDIKRVLEKYECAGDQTKYSGGSSYLLLAIISWIGGLNIDHEYKLADLDKT
jgi:hypothetical protein